MVNRTPWLNEIEHGLALLGLLLGQSYWQGGGYNVTDEGISKGRWKQSQKGVHGHNVLIKEVVLTINASRLM